MTTPTVKLVCGALELNLNDQTEFGVYPDFTPPDIAYTVAFAGGTSANTSGGAELANKAVTNTPFSFRVNVLGGSDADIRKNMGRIRRFLAFAEDQSEPLYLEFNSNSNIPRPLWGQGFFIRYQIAYGTVEYDKGYLVGASLSTDVDATLNLVIKGYPVGLRQRLGSAMGGIIEDNYGASDKTSRGLIVPEATTNLFTNPVFGNATYSTNWTIGSNLTASQNTNEKFVLPGCVNSMRVYARNTTNNTVTESLTLAASSHTITAYVMLPDLTAPASTQLQIYYNSAAQTTTYEAVGNNGLYRCYATVTGTGGALATGVVIKNKYTVYLLGMQAEAKAYPTPLCYGDLLGHSWSSTAHASTSARAVARVRVPIADDTYFRSGGSFTITVKMGVPNTHPNDMRLWFIDTSGALLDYQASSDKFRFYDGANIATSTAQTFSAGAIYTLHCTWGASGLALYVNGAADGSNATFTPTTTGSHYYLGVDSTPGSNTLATIMDFRTFDRQLTATEVANDYANVAQLTADNQRVGCIPWLWTKDGDDVVDNCDDATRDNWAVCGGVPGSAESNTEIDITPSSTSVTGYWLMSSAVDANDFAYPNTGTETGVWYGELQGTVDANASGGQYESRAVTTDPDYATITVSKAKLAQGKINFFVRMKDSATSRTFYFAPWYSYGSGTRVFYPSNSAKAIDTSYRWFFVGQMSFSQPEGIDEKDMTAVVGIQASSGGGGVTVHSDYMMIATGPTLRITCTASAGFAKLVVRNGRVESRTSGGAMFSLLNSSGEFPSFAPDKLNFVWFVTSADGEAHVITDTATFNSVYVTPRYQLL